MKKFLLSLAVAAAAFCVQAETITLTPTAPNAYWGSKCVGMGTITVDSQWGEFVLGNIDPAVYKAVKIEYTNASNVQFKVASPTEAYSAIADGDGEATIDISAQASAAKTEIQGMEKDAKITVTKVVFVKTDDTEEVQENVGTVGWGCAFSSNNIFFTHENGEAGFTSYPEYEAGKTLKVTITFDAAPAALNAEVIVPDDSEAVASGKAQQGYQDKYYVYLPAVEAEATSYTFDIDYAYTSFTLKATADCVEKVLSNVACTVEISDADSLGAIEAVNADSVAYDLFGNAGATKGFMVKGGQKAFVK